MSSVFLRAALIALVASRLPADPATAPLFSGIATAFPLIASDTGSADAGLSAPPKQHALTRDQEPTIPGTRQTNGAKAAPSAIAPQSAAPVIAPRGLPFAIRADGDLRGFADALGLGPAEADKSAIGASLLIPIDEQGTLDLGIAVGGFEPRSRLQSTRTQSNGSDLRRLHVGYRMRF